MEEFRCPNGIKFGELLDHDGDAVVEFRCRSNRCGHRTGVVVLHRFTLQGKFIDTQRFADPASAEH